MTDDQPTLHRPSSLKPSAARFQLEVVEGPDRGLRFELDSTSPRRLLGQSSACETRLSDPMVSRRHAAVEVVDAELHVTDLRSTNGTFVNDVRIGTAFLVGGEIVRVGSTSLRASVVASAPVAATEERDRFGALLGRSLQMQRLYPLLERLAASSVPVIIEGETGTGKEVLAEALHEQSARAGEAFAVFDCTAIAPSLVEAALFGHEKGAFTGALGARAGVFEEANGGTLLIDEIGELDLALQPKLLRAVQRGEVRRVGGDRWVRVDVRVLAATRRDLDREVIAGRFREDLFFRLNVARVELPPLRERQGDVGLLARTFWDRMAPVGQPIPYDLFQAWEDYAWPGNVRELENAVARRVALGDLAPALPTTPPVSSDRFASSLFLEKPLSLAKEALLHDFERQYLERMLERKGGSVADAIAASGVGRRYFNKLRARHQL
jgi:two-component system response regulator HydG